MMLILIPCFKLTNHKNTSLQSNYNREQSFIRLLKYSYIIQGDSYLTPLT